MFHIPDKTHTPEWNFISEAKEMFQIKGDRYLLIYFCADDKLQGLNNAI